MTVTGAETAPAPSASPIDAEETTPFKLFVGQVRRRCPAFFYKRVQAARVHLAVPFDDMHAGRWGVGKKSSRLAVG